jgi:hypothetical protein
VANEYVLTTDASLNTGNYIQNTNTEQPSSSFNVSGDGRVGDTLTGGTLKATTDLTLTTTAF